MILILFRPVMGLVLQECNCRCRTRPSLPSSSVVGLTRKVWSPRYISGAAARIICLCTHCVQCGWESSRWSFGCSSHHPILPGICSLLFPVQVIHPAKPRASVPDTDCMPHVFYFIILFLLVCSLTFDRRFEDILGLSWILWCWTGRNSAKISCHVIPHSVSFQLWKMIR